MPRPTAFAAALAAVSLALAGCGNERQAAPDVSLPQRPGKLVIRTWPGVRMSTPVNWALRAGRSPLVATSSSGRISVSIWRYRRAEPLPADRNELESARRALLRAIRERNDTFRVRASRIDEVGGRRAVVVVGRQRIRGQLRAVRSTHVFGRGYEVVVDQLAPTNVFPLVDRAVFQPMVDSLRLTRSRARRR